MRKKIELDIISTLRDAMAVTFQERKFFFNLALLPILLMGFLDIFILPITISQPDLLPNFIDQHQNFYIFLSAVSQWFISLPFVIGWILFLQGDIKRTHSIIKILQKFPILWRFVWRHVVFALLLLVIYGAITGLLLGAINVFSLAINDNITLFLMLLPAVLIAPFMFLATIDFVLNKKFQPWLLVQYAFHSYGKIFLTLWILALLFFGLLSIFSIILGGLLTAFGMDDITNLQDLITTSLSLSFAISILSNIFFFWLSTYAYNISYRYWQNINSA
ncbi:MAG: hypothetical protein ACR2NY_04255 [Alphaproteobacteria bacterium]